MSMYDKGAAKFPEMSGNAKIIGSLGAPLLIIFAHYMDNRNIQHKQVRALLKRTVRLEEIMQENRQHWKWPRAASTEFLKNTWEYLELKRALANHYHQSSPAVWLFHVTIKSHYLVHLALFVEHMNPTLVWNYSGESMMKRIKSLCQQNSRGTGWLNVEPKVMDQYVYGMEFLLDDQSGWWRWWKYHRYHCN